MGRYNIFINNINEESNTNAYGSISFVEDRENYAPTKGSVTINKIYKNSSIIINKYNSSGFTSTQSFKSNLLDKMPSGIQSKMKINLRKNPLEHFSYLGINFNDSYYK